MNVALKVKKYKTEGDIAWEYNPLRNIKQEDGSIVDFQVDNSLNISLENPIDIECQQAYDGSVNLILNDDINPPRIINSRIALLENNRYKIINRNQNKQSNLYNINNLDQETRLFRNVQKIPKIKLNKVSTYGQLQGGNYTFYLKYLDSDFNETDIVAETSIISIFHGTLSSPKTCKGAYMDERTDKSIVLNLYNIDTSFTYFNLYFVRNTCDENGVIVSHAYKILHNYEISSEAQLISITGFEELEEINTEELNIQYNYVESVKTQAQVQNRLFFANVTKNEDQSAELRNLSLHIIAEQFQKEDSIGYIYPENFTIESGLDESQTEYYSPQNIYYYLGYHPGELYRMGIVYIFNDDHLSPTYNLRGVDFNYVGDNPNFNFTNKIENIEFTDFLDKTKLENTGGVFRFSKSKEIIDYSEKKVLPLGIKFSIPEIVINRLKELNIKGYFFVRQKRIPNFLAQGFSIGVDKASGVPTLRNGSENGLPKYQAESFINKSRVLSTDYNSRLITSNVISSSGLLCVDAYVNKPLQSLFNSSAFKVVRDHKFDESLGSIRTRMYFPKEKTESEETDNLKIEKSGVELLYIDPDIPQRILDDYVFSTKAGLQEELKQLVCFGKTVSDDKWFTKYIRGVFTAFIGTKTTLDDNSIYSIYKGNYNEAFLEEYFSTRIKDNAPFYAISDRYSLINDSEVSKNPTITYTLEKCPEWTSYTNDYKFYQDLREYLTKAITLEQSIKVPSLTDGELYDNFIKSCSQYGVSIEKVAQLNSKMLEFIKTIDVDSISDFDLWKLIPTIPEFFSHESNYILYSIPIVYRGDCFTATVCTRMHRNFTSTSVPINDAILEPNSWRDSFIGGRSTTDWDDISKADVGAVPIGSWFTYKCLSNSNLGLRSQDYFNTDEYALMGNPRSFVPATDISTKSSTKILESALLNEGYNSTLGVRKNFAFEVLPYVKDEFDTRIMFSNVQVDGAFKNSYKVFQGLSYEDMDRQYGGLIKILPWENNILGIFEHAIAIIPVNEKALVQTTQGQNIHMYGAGVLQKQMTMISDMYGSSWKDSIIRTPRGVYGVDTYAKKIWRFSSNGFELISEFKIQRFLNDNINLQQLEKSIVLGVRNVKTHFNANKNDVMFTFYNRDKIWNICYNEISNLWVTRYSWTPFFSGNLYNSYFSFDLQKTKIYGILNENLRVTDSIILPMKPWNGLWSIDEPTKELMFTLNSDYSGFNVTSIKIFGSKWEENGISEELLYSDNCDDSYNFHNSSSEFTVNINNVIKPEVIDHEGKKYWALNGEPLLEYSDSESNYQKALYLSYLKIKNNNPFKITFNNKEVFDYLYYIVEIDYIPYLVTSYEGETDSSFLVFTNSKNYKVGLLLTEDKFKNSEQWRNALLSKVYMHGFSGIVDELDYSSPESTNRIFPTKWYDKQEPFEFEFVVNDPKGVHKIFDNLMIISNNVEPDSLEIEIVGDVYDFNKAGIFKYEQSKDPEYNDIVFKKLKIGDKKEYYTSVKWDPITNEYSLLVHQDCLNIKEYGRRVGNIYYNADVWRTVIQPIYYGKKDTNKSLKSVRIRDKYAKIRVKYKGDKLAIITALQSIMTQVYV